MKWALDLRTPSRRGWGIYTLALGMVASFAAMMYASSNGSALASQKFNFQYDFQSESTPPADSNRQPEAYLVSIQGHLARSEYTLAIGLTEQLISAYPNFQLAQWLYAELLNLTIDQSELEKNSALTTLTLTSADKAASINSLQTELGRRLRAILMPPPKATIPAGIGFLSPATEFFAVVDATASRMYVFKNLASASEPHKAELLFHSYASVGLNGLNKEKEGDGRSPVGVYFTQKRLPDKRLPDLYGVGALTLNYPNFLDVHRGRSGSGIWIHGSPSAQYSRAPQASDGCIVLPNDSMRRLMTLGKPKGIPIFIQEKIDWVAPSQYARLPDALSQLLVERYPFLESSLSLKALSFSGGSQYKQAELVHFLTWQDQGQQVALIDLSNTENKRLRTYWVNGADGWTLISESKV